ncbi:hypothetical protein LK494_02100 [Anaerovorax odorimutans]|nr:hypothetical protein [Anaerovorax odorimutans]
MKHKKVKVLILMLLISVFVFASITPAYAAKSKSSRTPVISKIVSTKSSVKVSWKKAKGTSKYYIYKKTAKGKYKKVATLSKKKSTYTDKKVVAGKKYAYRIVSRTKSRTYTSKSRSVTPVRIKAPQLQTLKRYTTDNKERTNISWKSVKGYSYDVLRRTGNGAYTKIASVKAKSSECSYTDKNINKNKNYTYTVKPIRKVGKILYKYGDYDSRGISTLLDKPKVNVDFTNLHATITWDGVEGAEGYKVYRKNSLNGDYRAIATVKAGNGTYKDVYRQSFTTAAEKDLLNSEYFLDPAHNGIVYTVRAYSDDGSKRSYSNYDKDGYFELTTPSIVDVTKNSSSKATIEWSTVKNAKNYYLYTGYNDASGSRHWQRITSVKHKSGTRQKATIDVNPDHPFFTVKAMSVRNGETIYSSYDKGFDISDRNYGNTNILYIGDSITFGSPYKGATTKEVFSYPWRVNQLTGVQYYNPSIPGATYAYKESTSRFRLLTDVAEKMEKGETPKEALYPNSQKYEDFDVVIMAAGTNDYLDNTELGDLDSNYWQNSKDDSNKEEDQNKQDEENNQDKQGDQQKQDIRDNPESKTFNGAINQIMTWIKEGSDKRVAKGKSPIKVVFVDLFYSDRTHDYAQLTNRFVTKNKIDLTLTDYQNDIDQLVKKYQNDPNYGLDIKQFSTAEFVTQSTCPYVTSDNLHMTRFTYTQIGNKLSKFLINEQIIVRK